MKTFAILALFMTSIAAAQTATQEPKPATEGIQQGAIATPKVTTALMFYGKAEEAMNFYISLFKNSKVIAITRWESGELGAEGSIKHALFSLDGQVLRCMDSPAPHNFTFTPAMSLFVECQTESEIDELFAQLSKDGEVLMPLQEYPFAKKFAWVDDRFGVSWQMMVPNNE